MKVTYMAQLFEFVTHHSILVSLFVFAVTFWLATEVRHRKIGPQKLSLQSAIAILNHQEGVLVDLRNAAEYNKGHVQGALHLPLAQISGATNQLQKVKGKPVILACQAGQQAPTACATLKKQGFEALYYLEGGMAAWISEHLPVVK